MCFTVFRLWSFKILVFVLRAVCCLVLCLDRAPQDKTTVTPIITPLIPIHEPPSRALVETHPQILPQVAGRKSWDWGLGNGLAFGVSG